MTHLTTTILSMPPRRGPGDGWIAANDFVGRLPELDRIRTLLLGSARLITLTGAGGIGKTRLATETLRGFAKSELATIYWTRLARLSEGADIAAIEDEVARSVVGADFSQRSAWDAIIDALTGTDAVERSPRTVLVMDNCEHVHSAAGRFVAELLDAMPRLTVLATSREALGWVDEYVIAVPPLTRKQSLTLFRQRVELTGRTIADADELAMANLVCQHVHDHPLFVRLAAARLRHQSLAVILRDLSGEAADKRMSWSHGPQLGAEPRHQGIRDVIAWSYKLCPRKEQLLLDRMSVFASGYDANFEDENNTALDIGADLEAVVAVCADHSLPTPVRGPEVATLAGEEVEHLLERLTEKSLVTAYLTPTSVRYSLLESIRIFAHQQLSKRSTQELNEPVRFAQRHLRYYRDKVVAVQLDWFSDADQNWTQAAWDNIVTAIEWSITSVEPELGLELASGLIALPFFKGSPREIRRWTDRILDAALASTPQPVDLQINAMSLIGWISMMQGRNNEVEHILEECAARVCDLKAQQNWRENPETDIGLPAAVEFLWGSELGFADRDSRAVIVLARAREKYQSLGDFGGEARSELYESWIAATLGSRQQAIQTARHHLDNATSAGAGWAKAWAELAWAIALTRYGDTPRALELERATLKRQIKAHDRWGAALTVKVQTWSLGRIIKDAIAADSLDHAKLKTLATETAHLIGGATTLGAASGINLDSLALIAHENEKAIEIARQVLGRQAFATAFGQGRLLRVESDEPQRLALGELSIRALPAGHPARMSTSAHWEALSPAEQRIAMLAAAGWTNVAIAARRGSSRRTVDAQMASIFQKLIITSRADIVKLVPQDRIGQVQKEVERRPARARTRP